MIAPVVVPQQLKLVILSEAKDLLCLDAARKQVPRFAQDDKANQDDNSNNEPA
jgi:hypothetical protein